MGLVEALPDATNALPTEGILEVAVEVAVAFCNFSIATAVVELTLTTAEALPVLPAIAEVEDVDVIATGNTSDPNACEPYVLVPYENALTFFIAILPL